MTCDHDRNLGDNENMWAGDPLANFTTCTIVDHQLSIFLIIFAINKIRYRQFSQHTINTIIFAIKYHEDDGCNC